MAEEKKPKLEIEYGSVRASIWINESGKGDAWYVVTTSRQYRKVKEQWQSSHSFRMRLIPMLSSPLMSACNGKVAKGVGKDEKSGVECLARDMDQSAFAGGNHE